MYTQKPLVLFVRYALPQMIGLLLNSVYLIVDGIFIGNRLGREAMAAAAVSVPVIEILIALALFVASGAGVLISNKLGENKTGEANRIFNLSVAVLAGISVCVVVCGNLFLTRFATMLGATQDIHGSATIYLWYIVSFSPFLLFSFLLSTMARSDNRPRLAMVALAVGSVSNIVLDYVFMYPLDMGITGAALATALGPIFSILILAPHFMRKGGCLYFASIPKPNGYIRQMAILGFPAFIMEFSIGIVTLAYNSAIVVYGFGEIGLAAYLLLGYLLLIIMTLFLGIAQGLQPVFSYYDGAKEYEQSRSLLAFSNKAIIVTGLLTSVLAIVYSREFAMIFASGDPELVDFTSKKTVWYFWGIVFAGYNILTVSYWQSVQQTGKALLLSLLRSVIIVPVLLILLPAVLGKEAIWTCHSLAEAASVGVMLLSIRVLLKGKKQRNTSRAVRTNL